MLDFNTKKEMLRRLKAKRSKNKILWLPCAAAELFIKLWYAFLCRADMALSDRNGKFLGIKQPVEKKGVRRQDDIVYVKKPFWGRVMSAVLAASFVLMFVPELGISFEVEAADPTPGLSIKVNTPDGPIDATIVASSGVDSTYLVNYADYWDVKQKSDYKATDIQCEAGYGAVRITWKKPNIASNESATTQLKNYDIYLYQDGEEIAQKTNISNKKEAEIFKDIKNPNSEVYAVIVPRYSLIQYLYRGALDPDNLPGDITVSYSGTYERDGTECTGSAAVPNAYFEIPALNIKDAAGNETSECRTGSSIELTWEPRNQIGGFGDGSPADEYVIYRYDVINKRFDPTITAIPDGSIGSISKKLDYNSFVPGMHYRFFVEANRNIWNGDGIISSSKGYINAKPEDKMTSVYTKDQDYKDLYVAPLAPDLKATVKDFKSKSINLSWKSTDGIFDGVELYRSIGEIYPIPSEVSSGKTTFADWLRAEARNNSAEYAKYKITSVGDRDYKSSITSADDINLAEGVEYNYYAIAYITKNGNPLDKLYSEPAMVVKSLTLDLARPQISITKGDGRVDVSWTAVDGADGYELEITQNSKYDPVSKKIVTLNPPITKKMQIDKGTSFPHTELYNGEQYTYVVTPYVMIETSTGSKPYYSTPSDPRSVTVGLGIETPENLTADGSKDGQVTIKWNSVPGATGYILYYRNTSVDDFDEENTEYKEISTTKTTYIQTKLHNDDVYEYYVVAYKRVNEDGHDGVQTVYSDPSEHAVARVGTLLSTPQNLKALTTDGSISLSWDKVNSAEGYLLHYKYDKKTGESSGYTEKTFFDVTGEKYTHSGLNNGDKYTYYIEAYKEVNGKRVFGPQSDEAWAIVGVPLDAPKDFSGTTKDGQVDLKWSASKGAEGYELYFRKNGGAWEHVDVSKPGFQHIGLGNGDRYEYYVTAYKTVNGERVYSSESNHLSFKIGDDLDSPKDFTAVTSDGQVSLTWTAVKGAEGYVLYAYGNGRSYQYDLSKPSYLHTGLNNGDSWTYYVVAYKTVNGTRVYSNPTKSITVTTGVSLNSVVDLTATAGNRQIDLSWTKVNGAEGYVVYLYNSKTMEFEPITVITGTKYSHTGLKNGQKYTYMVAPYKTINGERFYGEYSMSVSATPSTGLDTDIDNTLTVRGTTPYGISHSEYIDASANHAAFDEPVDVYFTTNRESTEAVKDVLKHYADGLKSFVIYPFDISIYREGTKIEVDPNDGYTVTITMPIPDRLIAYRDYITVVHIGDGMEETEEITAGDAEDWIRTADTTLEVLPCAVVDIDNVWCVQFVCSSFSPYALVIYKDHISDVSSGGGILNGDFAGSFNSGVLLFTALPDIMPHNKKLKVVQGGQKRYRIKSIEKR